MKPTAKLITNNKTNKMRKIFGLSHVTKVPSDKSTSRAFIKQNHLVSMEFLLYLFCTLYRALAI